MRPTSTASSARTGASAPDEASPPSVKPRDRATIEATLFAGAAFVVYAAGACPTVFVGDSGELAAAVHTLGIPHPSGYPLYVLLGKLWTLAVPLGSVAGRLSLFSAACAAATVGLVFLVCRQWGSGRVAAATGAALLAVAPSFWGEANVQRVYALNALFVVLATAFAFRWHRTGAEMLLVAAFFVCGLGASNHTFMAVEALALFLFVAVARPRLLRQPRLLLASAGAFVTGLLPYLYLPLRSRQNPRLDWGDPETMGALLHVVLRRDYWPRAWVAGPSDLVAVVADYLRGLGAELLWAGAVLALLGALAGARRGWPVAFPLLVMLGNLAAVALHGSRADIFIWHRYDIPSYVMAALLAAMGCEVLCAGLPRRLRLLPLAVPALGLILGCRDFDRSRYRIAEDFSRRLLASLPPGAHLAANDDNILFVLVYLSLVEGVRPDVDLILQAAGVEEPPLRFDPDAETLFFTHHPNWNVPGVAVVPAGLVFQVVRSGQGVPTPGLSADGLAGAEDPEVPKDYLTRNLIGHFHFMRGLTLSGHDWAKALDELMKAARAAPDDDVLFYNLGLHYLRNGLYAEALAAFERCHAINPRRVAAPDGPRAADRIAEARAEMQRLRAVEDSLSSDLPPLGTRVRARLLAERLAVAGEAAAARGVLARAERALASASR